MRKERGVPPVVSFVGNSGVGKTTFLENLVPVLKRRSYRLAAVKHDVHNFQVDYPGKDSYRLTAAGSDIVILSAGGKLALMETLPAERTLEELVEMVADRVDIVLTEGYRGATAAKIEVSRHAQGTSLTASIEDLIALITDHPFDLDLPQFGLDSFAAVADFLEGWFALKRPRQLIVS